MDSFFSLQCIYCYMLSYFVSLLPLQGLNPGLAIGEIKKMLIYYNQYKDKPPMTKTV